MSPAITSSESGRPREVNSTTTRSTTPVRIDRPTTHGPGHARTEPTGEVDGGRPTSSVGCVRGYVTDPVSHLAAPGVGPRRLPGHVDDRGRTDSSDRCTRAAPARERWTAQWKELYAEVITSGLCTGCAGCVISCPHDVIGYDHEQGGYKPFHLEDELGPDDCIHGEKGCTTLHPGLPPLPARGSPRPTSTSSPASRERRRDRRHLQRHPAHPGQRRHGAPDGPGRRPGVGHPHLGHGRRATSTPRSSPTSRASRPAGRPSPAWPPTATRCWPAAGSRYTYSANTLAIDEALERGFSKLALVGMSCQSSVPPVMWSRKIGKISKPIVFNIGLLCSKTFDDAIFEELFEAKYGLTKAGHGEDEHQGRLPDLDAATAPTTRSTSRSATPGPARAAPTAPTSPPSTPTSPPAASARTTTGRSPSSAPTSAARSCSA